MTLDEFILAATRRYMDVKDERYGQAFFNELYRVRPDLSEEIRGGHLDPFYTGVDPDLYLFLSERW